MGAEQFGEQWIQTGHGLDKGPKQANTEIQHEKGLLQSMGGAVYRDFVGNSGRCLIPAWT